MSYKLVIADDEPLILVGLQSMLDWASLDISVAGAARNGGQLMELIETVSPDIVITDIRMPVKSGIDVMRECASRFGRLPLFIILTSHEEYSYVKEAISCQAVNYLVKIELSREILADAIARAISILIDIKRLSPPEEGRSGMQPFVDRFFVRLLNGLFETREQYEQQMIDLAFNPPNGACFAAYCGIEGIDADRMEKDKLVNLYSNTVAMVRETVGQNIPCQVIGLDMRHFAIVFCHGVDERETADSEIFDSLFHAVTLVRNYFAVSLRCSIGKRASDLFDIHESFASARRIHALQTQTDPVILFGKGEIESIPESTFDMAKFRDGLTRAFQELDFGVLAEVLAKIIGTLTATGANHAKAMDASCGVLYMATSLLPDGEEIISGIFSGVKDGYRSVYECKTADDCCAWLDRLRNGLVDVLQNRKQDYRLRVVTKVQRYIDDNIGRRLLLSEVASIYGFSQNYLSALFSRYGGCSFVEYTTQAKISAAKKLMAGGELKINEIADRLGFESAFYFSKVFKKVEGISPREYMQQAE